MLNGVVFFAQRLAGAPARPVGLSVGLAGLAGVLVLACAGCRQEMHNQLKADPLEQSLFFEDGGASRPLPLHTVARGQLRADDHFYRGKTGTNLVKSFPFPISPTIVQRGQERFDIYCAVCHGAAGDGDGMIVQRGFPAPPSFHSDRLREAPVGHVVDVINNGYGVMYSYAAGVEPRDRWAIAAYIRALQLSRQVPVEMLSSEERAQLEGTP